MVSEENLALIKKGYDAFGKGDLEFIRTMVSLEGVWRTPGYGMLEHEYKGPDGVISYLSRLSELTEGTFKSESEALFFDGDRVVSLDHITGVRKGIELDTYVVHVFSFRDGKVIEVTDFVSEPERNAAFWS